MQKLLASPSFGELRQTVGMSWGRWQGTLELSPLRFLALECSCLTLLSVLSGPAGRARGSVQDCRGDKDVRLSAGQGLFFPGACRVPRDWEPRANP